MKTYSESKQIILKSRIKGNGATAAGEWRYNLTRPRCWAPAVVYRCSHERKAIHHSSRRPKLRSSYLFSIYIVCTKIYEVLYTYVIQKLIRPDSFLFIINLIGYQHGCEPE